MITPTPEFMLRWLRANRKAAGSKQHDNRLPNEKFFEGCKSEQEKHARVTAAYPEAYRKTPKRRGKK